MCLLWPVRSSFFPTSSSPIALFHLVLTLSHSPLTYPEAFVDMYYQCILCSDRFSGESISALRAVFKQFRVEEWLKEKNSSTTEECQRLLSLAASQLRLDIPSNQVMKVVAFIVMAVFFV